MMKKFMILGVFLCSNTLAQSPVAPDKNPPVVQRAIPQTYSTPQTFSTPQIQQSFVVPEQQTIVVQQQYIPRIVSVVQPLSIVHQQSLGFDSCGVNSFGFNRSIGGFGRSIGGFRGFEGFGANQINFADRRGNVVTAFGNRDVRIRRNILGQIRDIRAR
jgi:hypothetical protein